MSIWSKIPTWGQWIAGTAAGIGVLYSTYLFADEAIDRAIVTESELAEVITQQRLSQNQVKLSDLTRDIIAERYANEAEKEFILREISRLQKEIKCDTEGKCEE